MNRPSGDSVHTGGIAAKMASLEELKERSREILTRIEALRRYL
jgi:hypothetical protein